MLIVVAAVVVVVAGVVIVVVSINIFVIIIVLSLTISFVHFLLLHFYHEIRFGKNTVLPSDNICSYEGLYS